MASNNDQPGDSVSLHPTRRDFGDHSDSESRNPDTEMAPQLYLGVINQIERLHRQFLEVIKNEIEQSGIQDINNIQTIILYNIGDQEVTVGELTNRGYYLGSNVSYNLKKMVENGYLIQERSSHDRRSMHVHVSEKGRLLCRKVDTIFNRHIDFLRQRQFVSENLVGLNEALTRLGSFYTDILTRFGGGVAGPPGGIERRRTLNIPCD